MDNLINEQNLFEKSRPGRGSFSFDKKGDWEDFKIDSRYLRKTPIELPEISERDLVRHYQHCAKRTFNVDEHFYPLGSCTMKYNPKINEKLSCLEGFINVHPLQDDDDLQGILEVFYDLDKDLSFITGMDQFALQPAAGAQGELCALKMLQKYYLDRGESRSKVVIPDSSHGTNAASATMCGLEVISLPSKNGEVDVEALAEYCDEKLACFMLTIPNTLGLFERNIEKILDLVHQCGAKAYCDGANLNALMGITSPGKLGFDIMHVNLHKTFSTPHGGGGPGAGPVGVKEELVPYLPGKIVFKSSEGHYVTRKPERSIGAVKVFNGNFLVLLRAYIYIKSLGYRGLKETSLNAVVNANYLKEKLKDEYHVPYNRPCMHEFVMTPSEDLPSLKTFAIAKRLLDYGVHAPTVYFPLTVPEVMMIEPTETENLDTLDEYVEIMKIIKREFIDNPKILDDAPHNTYRKRLDEVKAARKPKLSWVDE